MKTFFCRYCGQEERTYDTRLPDGWYHLTRRVQKDERGFVRLGIYCSLACLMDFSPVLAREAKMYDDKDSFALTGEERRG